MYKHIMVPVDLEHVDTLEKALRTAADLGRHYGCSVTYVGVAAATPGSVAHNPQEFAAKLDAFAAAQAARHGHEARARSVISHDPTADLDRDLVDAATAIGADLVVMATHPPSIADYLWPSNGGRMAAHSDFSVMLVRPG